MIDVEKYLGKPFVYGGRGPDAYDCYGLVLAIYRDVFDVELPDFESRSDLSYIHQKVLEGSMLFNPIPHAETGSVIAFALHPRYVTHVGVAVKGGKFIHILRQSSVTVERLDAPEWARRVRGYYRWPA